MEGTMMSNRAEPCMITPPTEPEVVQPRPDDPFLLTPNRDSPYSTLPFQGPHAVGVGHALITMVEPHLGHDRTYNRWYEDYHFFDGAMQMPWMYAGRRWVAPHDLQQLRYPGPSPVASPLSAGKYLGTYWITRGRVQEHIDWAAATNARNRAIGNIDPNRSHIYTAFHDTVGAVYRGDDVPPARFALMDPAPGIVLQVVDAPTPEGRDDLQSWLVEEYLPSRVTPNGPVSLALAFQARTPGQFAHSVQVYADMMKVANGGRRLAILWFLTKDPRETWESEFRSELENVRDGGKGETVFVAPFIPSKMGTDAHVDQLRGPVAELSEPAVQARD